MMDDNVEKNMIARNFSRSALSYDEHSFVQKYCATILMGMIGDLSPKKVLEIGCGTGCLTAMLAERWPYCRISAVDISDEMIDVARNRIKGPGVDFMVLDAETMDLPGAMDLVISNASMQWFDDLEGVISRLIDVMDSGSSLVFSVYGPDTFRELNQVLSGNFGPSCRVAASFFKKRSDLEQMFSRFSIQHEITEEYFSRYFHSFWDLLSGIKKAGVQGKGIGGAFLGKYAIAEMEKEYIKKYGRIVATHHVYFIRCDL